MQFTDEQNRVFNFIKLDSNHGIIDAVAGSGKTSTIVESARYIPKDKRILFCAFNKSIASEIKARFSTMGMDYIVVKTMHALGLDILKDNNRATINFNIKKYDEILDSALQSDVFESQLEQILIANNIPVHSQNYQDERTKKNFIRQVREIVLQVTNKYRLTLTKDTIEDFREFLSHYNLANNKSSTFEKESEAYFYINRKLIEKGISLFSSDHLVDYADMLFLPYFNKYSPSTKYDFIFIDECQDLSRSQLTIALKYAKKECRILSVGDPFQSIYGFTGADINSFNKIKNSIPNTVVLTLSYCFRCPDNMLELARNFRADIQPFQPKEGVIEKIPFDKVIEVVGEKNLIICRTKAPLQVLMFKLIEKGIEIAVHEDEVKEFINDLRFLFFQNELNASNISDDFDFFEKVKSRNADFAKKKSNNFQDEEEGNDFYANEVILINAKIDFIRKQCSIHTDTNNLNQLFKKIEKLISGGENAVKLSTIHRAKGLENDVVFILDYDLLPMYRIGQKDWEMVQENNLKYVALTRAKQKLFLVDSQKVIETIDEEGDSLFDSIEIDW